MRSFPEFCPLCKNKFWQYGIDNNGEGYYTCSRCPYTVE